MHAPTAEPRPLKFATSLLPVGAWLDRHLGILFMLPGLLCLLAVIAYPVAYNLVFSFTNKDLVYPGVSFVGLENFSRALRDPDFWNAVRVSVVWTSASVGFQLLLGLVAALCIEEIRHGRAAFRLLLILPWAFPPIVMALVWRFLFDGLYGAANYMFVLLGFVSAPIPWFGSPHTALGTLIVMNVWFGIPFMMLAILAGLQTIPRDHYDVARVEGASYFQQLRYLVLPSLRGVIGILLVLRTIWVFNNFDFVFLTTAGGPGKLTETLPLYAYRVGWVQFHVGRMAAVAVLTMIMLFVIIYLYFRLLPLDEEEGGR